jgi:hypothetical protein
MHSKGISAGDEVVYRPAFLESITEFEEMRVYDVCCLGVIGASGELVLWEDIVGVVK